MSAPDGPSAAAANSELHLRIQLEATAVRALGGGGPDEIKRRPALRALLEDAMHAIESSIPSSFEHKGRRYYTRACLRVVDIGVHATPEEPMPFVRVLTEGGKWAGHRPGH